MFFMKFSALFSFQQIHSILKSEKIPTILRCYDVVAFSDHEGIIEYLSGFSSFHDIKKTMNALGYTSFAVKLSLMK